MYIYIYIYIYIYPSDLPVTRRALPTWAACSSSAPPWSSRRTSEPQSPWGGIRIGISVSAMRRGATLRDATRHMKRSVARRGAARLRCVFDALARVQRRRRQGDVELTAKSMEAMNAKSDPTEEELGHSPPPCVPRVVGVPWSSARARPDFGMRARSSRSRDVAAAWLSSLCCVMHSQFTIAGTAFYPVPIWAT